MNNRQIGTKNLLGIVSTDRHIVDARDFNGDHKANILCQHESGAALTWDMDGTQVAARHLLDTVPNFWHLQSDPLGFI